MSQDTARIPVKKRSDPLSEEGSAEKQGLMLGKN